MSFNEPNVRLREFGECRSAWALSTNWRAMMKLAFLILVLLTLCSQVALSISSSTSATCGQIYGDSRADLQNLKRFCDAGISEGAAVGAYAMETLLTMKVSRTLAYQMRADPLGAKQLVLTWMRGWRQMTGSAAVTVYVKWGDVEIAEGDSSLFGSDTVTLH